MIHDKILSIVFIALLVVTPLSGYKLLSIYSYGLEYNVVSKYQICNSDDIFNLTDCDDIWNVYYVKDGVLGHDWISGNKINGLTILAMNNIYVEESKIGAMYFDDNLQIYLTVLEHEFEHMKCGCNFHGWF